MARTPMPASIDEFRDLVAEQQSQIERQQETIDELSELVSFLREWKRLAQSQRFGRKSERFADEQAWLFNEAELTASEAPAVEAETVEVPAHARRKAGRKPLPDHLPVEEIVHDLADDQKVCPHDASHTMVEIGRETSEKLRFIPAEVVRERHICQVTPSFTTLGDTQSYDPPG